jgi:hypothetical protein
MQDTPAFRRRCGALNRQEHHHIALRIGVEALVTHSARVHCVVEHWGAHGAVRARRDLGGHAIVVQRWSRRAASVGKSPSSTLHLGHCFVCSASGVRERLLAVEALDPLRTRVLWGSVGGGWLPLAPERISTTVKHDGVLIPRGGCKVDTHDFRSGVSETSVKKARGEVGGLCVTASCAVEGRGGCAEAKCMGWRGASLQRTLYRRACARASLVRSLE